MRSALSKPLHPVAGAPMLVHVLRATAAADPVGTVLVVQQGATDLPARLGLDPSVVAFVQEPPLGTGDALRRALPVIADVDILLVVFADHPLLDGETVRRLRDTAASSGALVTVLAVPVDGGGYGRLEVDGEGRLQRIVERTDDDPEKRAGPFMANSGMMALDARWARSAVPRLSQSAATGEFYLTELVELAIQDRSGGADSWPVAVVDGHPGIALGVNDRVELAAADASMRQAIRERLMRSGVTMVGPETVFVDADVEIGPDTTLLPFSIVSGPTTIGRGCTIGPNAVVRRSILGDRVRVESSTVEGCSIGDDSDVGPYSHLRSGTVVGPRVHIGNFAEIKNGRLETGVKVGHVAYLGDCLLGAGTNIGAGTITANYDGERKHRTEIGPGAFIGSDTILRAPLRIGAGARTGAGSVVTRDVAAGATVVGVPARQIRSGPAPAVSAAAEEEE
ncbi:MAG: bifunctional UDP-N-acetylglucosamine diphosphorylase/glucosamine-1-phosphate N-acetyltransferase GlmU [Chloroflexia bacterium]|nr:bifunctional UDP-N-acetylglucosamine diphosphorylase/glucosamine-1-phosphate N-acetyltransferase GlmU [Chloroflexia bacterium]